MNLLEKAKQRDVQQGLQPQPDSPPAPDTLMLILDALEALSSRIANVERQQKSLSGQQTIMVEDLSNQISKVSTTPPSGSSSKLIHSIAEIEKTLSVFAKNLDGKAVAEATELLIAQNQRNQTTTATVYNQFAQALAKNTALVGKVGEVAQRIEQRAVGSIERAAEAVAGNVGTAISSNLEAVNDRAERILTATAKLEARQLWSSVAAMFLALLPFAVVLAGLWGSVAVLLGAWDWALDVRGDAWLGVWRWFAVGLGVCTVCVGLFYSSRWLASLVGTWKSRGVPRWPRWRK